MTAPIVRHEEAGFVIHGKNDGCDYWRLVRACIAEHIDQDALRRNHPARPAIPVCRDGVEVVLTPLAYGNPKRMVFRMEADGRAYVLKRAYMGTIGLRRLFPRLMGTTYFTRIMKMVNAAVAAGSRVTQDCFLVAEKWLGPFRQEIWVLLEYVEGDSLGQRPDFDSRREALETTVENLLAHDLTMDDLTLHNFIDSGQEIYAIDVSCRPFTWLQKGKMRLKMRQRYGLRLPARSVADKALEAVLSLRYRLRRALGGKGI